MTAVGYGLGFIGAGLLVASYLMQRMLPLRSMALSANVCPVIQAFLSDLRPTMLLHLAMLPINIKKVLHRRSLLDAMAQAKADTPVAARRLPHRRRRLAKAGETLWHKGEVATKMFCVETAQVRLKEPDVALRAGALLGEIGLFSPDDHRTGTSACDTDCGRHTRSAEGRAQL